MDITQRSGEIPRNSYMTNILLITQQFVFSVVHITCRPSRRCLFHSWYYVLVVMYFSTYVWIVSIIVHSKLFLRFCTDAGVNGWYYSQPNHYDNYQPCLSMHKGDSYKWGDETCHKDGDKYGYICEYGNTE